MPQRTKWLIKLSLFPQLLRKHNQQGWEERKGGRNRTYVTVQALLLYQTKTPPLSCRNNGVTKS